MAGYGCVLLLVTMSCMMVSAAPQFGLGFSGLLGGGGLYGGYGQYGGHYGHGHHHEYYSPHHHHDYHYDPYHDHHHYDPHYGYDHYHDHHHHGHYYKRDVSGLQQLRRSAETHPFNEDILTPPDQPLIISDPKYSPVDYRQ